LPYPTQNVSSIKLCIEYCTKSFDFSLWCFLSFLDQYMIQCTKVQSSFDHIILSQSVYADRAVSIFLFFDHGLIFSGLFLDQRPLRFGIYCV